MLTAYVDESGWDQNDWMFVAGYFGDDTAWKKLPAAWKEAIAPREHLHMRELRFKRNRHKDMLEKAGAVPKACGLDPMLAGVRYKDFSDMMTPGTQEERVINGYIVCCFAMTINTLRGIPKDERIEIIFESHPLYNWMTDLAMRCVSEARDNPEILLPDGSSKLANWRFVSKDSTSLTEPADYFAYALLQNWRDRKSLRATLCRPIMDAHENYGLGAVLHRDTIRKVIHDGRMMELFDTVKRTMRLLNMDNPEYETFNSAMDKLLKADPEAVRKLMEDDKRIRAEARKAKRASSDPGPDDPA